MQRFLGFVAICFAMAAVSCIDLIPEAEPFDTIEYRGQSIKLSREFVDYEDYENDPDKFAPEEIPKVQKLVKTAPLAKQFDSREDMSRAMFDAKFPGCGFGFFGEDPQADGSVLALVAFEIPSSGTNRYLLYRGENGRYTLIDEFIHDWDAGIMKAHQEGDTFVYTTIRGEKVIERTPQAETDKTAPPM